MKWQKFLYHHIEDSENTWFYQPGGFHPVRIGDSFQGRYRIVHKLGHGGHSTIWLARDDDTSTLVAIKVGLSGEDHAQEIDALSRINGPSFARQSDGSSLFQTVLDQFSFQGPNGEHSCLVTPMASCNLRDCKGECAFGLFQLPVARALAAQLAVAVAWMHEQGYVHGDLHMGNVLLHLPSNVDRLSDEQLYAKYGTPQPEEMERMDEKPIPPNAPHNAIWRVWFVKDSKDLKLSEAKILLIDLGTAFQPSDEIAVKSLTPLYVRAPENHFEPAKGISFASDIWSLACTMFEILGQRSLFSGCMSNQNSTTSEHVNALGPLPAAWWESWSARSKYCSRNGEPLDDHASPTLKARFEDRIQNARRDRGMVAMDTEEADDFLNMIRWMLTFKPDDRPTAKQVLQSDWMKKWGLPHAAPFLPKLDFMIQQGVMEHSQSLHIPITLRTWNETKAIDEMISRQTGFSH